MLKWNNFKHVLVTLLNSALEAIHLLTNVNFKVLETIIIIIINFFIVGWYIAKYSKKHQNC